MIKDLFLQKGKIYIVDLPMNKNHIQAGTRPCILLNSNNVISTIIPLTSKMNKLDKNNAHISIKTYDKKGNSYNSLVLLEQVQTVPTSYIKGYYGYMNNLDKEKLNNKIIKNYCIAWQIN